MRQITPSPVFPLQAAPQDPQGPVTAVLNHEQSPFHDRDIPAEYVCIPFSIPANYCARR